MEAVKKEKIHYAWVILAACCLLQGGIVGIGQNCRGIFYNPVCAELGAEVSQFTAYSLFYGVASFLTMPFAAKLLQRFNTRLVLTLSVLLYGFMTFLMGSMHSLIGFYIVGFLQGAGGTLLIFYICPLLIANWFDRFYGTAMGIYACFAGIMGVVINPPLNSVIESYGWRTGYRVQAVAVLLMAVPAALLMKSLKPEKLGLTRYGSTGELKAKTVTQSGETSAWEKKAFAALLLFTIFTSIVNAFGQHFARYAVSIGYSSEIGALLVSCSMIGNILCKLAMGVGNDRIGAKRTVIVSCLISITGLGLMLVSTKPVLFSGAFLAGVTMPLCSVCVPMIEKYIFGVERYMKFHSKIMMVSALFAAGGITVLGRAYEIFQGYRDVFLLGILLSAGCIALACLADFIKKRGTAAA